MSFIKRVAGCIIPYRLYCFISRYKSSIENTIQSDGDIPDSSAKKIGEYWSNQERLGSRSDAWFESDMTVSHINMKVSGSNSDILSEGLNELLMQQIEGRCLHTAVSVGCGDAAKELRLLQRGAVERFILFELSEERMRIAAENARRMNLENRVVFRLEDAFASNLDISEVDLVHWNNALHHMFDVRAAIQWSYDVLKPGGLFYMDDFVGPDRFQYPQEVIDIVNGIRDELPGKYLKNPDFPNQRIGDYENIDLEWFENEGNDPSEAADSSRILKSIESVFPQAKIIKTGGIVYFLTLTGLYKNFDETNPEDASALARLLELDWELAQNPDVISPYAVALAVK